MNGISTVRKPIKLSPEKTETVRLALENQKRHELGLLKILLEKHLPEEAQRVLAKIKTFNK